MNAIRVRGLTKRFDELLAVDDVSFTVESGDFFGLLGPNGAGKSTIINVLCTLLRPTAGEIEVAGFDRRADPGRVRESIGIVFQEPALDERLTGRENLRFHAMLYGLYGAEGRKRVSEVLGLVDLEAKSDVPVGEYSGGMKRRLEIARGLVHRPDVLFLDEPTLGLDARTRRRTREYLRDLNAETGVTVVLTTHEMDEADRLCDRIAICDRGSVVALDSPEQLKRRVGGGFVAVTIGEGGGHGALATRLADESWVESVERVSEGSGDRTLHVGIDRTERGDRRVPAVVAAATEVGVPVTAIDVREPTLETVFLALTGSTIAERESTDDTARGSDSDDGLQSVTESDSRTDMETVQGTETGSIETGPTRTDSPESGATKTEGRSR